MFKFDGFNDLNKRLQEMKRQASYQGKAKVTVGYTQKYAIYVHENLEMKLAGQPRPSGLGVYWGPEGAGPKFLERPARQLASDLGDIVAAALKRGIGFGQALYLAGMRLQAESQKLVPVEYGLLRASAFTRLDES